MAKIKTITTLNVFYSLGYALKHALVARRMECLVLRALFAVLSISEYEFANR